MENQIKELTSALSICLEEITALKQQCQQQEQQINAMKETFHVVSESINEIITEVNRIDETLDSTASTTENTFFYVQHLQGALDNIKYEILSPNQPRDYFYPHILDSSIAIDRIIKERKSIARFGDGEFAIMMKVVRQRFQRLDDHLAERLLEVLHSNHPDLLVAIADNYGALDKYNAHGALGIRIYMTAETRAAHQRLLEPDREYYDAYMSRPYALFRDNLTDAPRQRFQHLQQIWQNRDVIFVEGSLTRLGVGNDLFDNARTIQRIIAPPTSSFDRYNDIFNACLEYGTKDTLFLLAIGPCAGVLAYDLCLKGYQAVDIGHVDLEYEWFRQGTGARCAVPTKYNNEFQDGHIVADIDDPIYSSQILCSFA